MMPATGNGCSSGFTFIEILVAIVGIGMVVSGLTAGLAASLKNTAVVREAYQATFIAQATMEDVLLTRRVAYDNITDAYCASLGSLAVGGKTFSRNVS
ncbi:MAG: type II secretion system protein, partial [Magnetococcales bacterium]|nr:type II secretion system protein [Magnetococcales bacterium]